LHIINFLHQLKKIKESALFYLGPPKCESGSDGLKKSLLQIIFHPAKNTYYTFLFYFDRLKSAKKEMR